MKIGFIGLGMMGSGMAANLQKAGHDLVVHDLRRAAAEPYLTAGAVWADNPRAVAEASEVVFTSLPGPPEVEAVALGDNGLLGGMSRGKAYFDLSTNSPTVVRKINAAFAERDVYMLELAGQRRAARRAHRQARALGRRRRANLQPLQDRARRHGRQGTLCRPDRRRLGGQARAQRRGLLHPDCTRRNVHGRGQGRGRTAGIVGSGARRRHRQKADLRRADRPVPAGNL